MTGFFLRIGYNDGQPAKGGGDVVIYADILFALNAMIDYLLLLVSARAAGAPLHRRRFLLGAVIGGIYAVALFLPGFSFLNHGVYKVLSALLMLMTAYGATRMLLKQALIFIALTWALGGGVMAIGMMDGARMSLGRSVVYSIPDIKMILLSASGCYAVFTLVLPKVFRHTTAVGEVRPVEFELMGRRIQLMALTDTGNTLSDPVTGDPVPVAEGRALYSLFPSEACPKRMDLEDPVQGIARLNQGVWRGRFYLLPYRAVGVERGFLLAVKMDRVVIGRQEKKRTLVALSPTPVSDGGGYCVLTGG